MILCDFTGGRAYLLVKDIINKYHPDLNIIIDLDKYNERLVDGTTQTTLLQFLLEKFYDPEDRGDLVNMIRFLIANGADPTVKSDGKDTYDTLRKININHPERIKRILDERPAAPAAPAAPIVPAVPNYEKLWWDELNKNKPRLEKLREYIVHVDVNKANSKNEYPLFIGARKDNLPLLKMIIEAGANINIQDIHSVTALIEASYSGYSEIVKFLIDAGANVNMQSNNGITALIWASNKGYDEIVKTLLAAGADKTIKDKDGKTAFDYAKKEEIMELLDPSPSSWTGFTRSDIAFTNEVFHQHIHPTNLARNFKDKSLFSMCPICLRYIEHESGTCMYMTHSCIEGGGFERYYHRKLWNIFKYSKQLYDARGNPSGTKEVVEWCTLCGRICNDHKHYELKQLYDDSRNIIIPKLITTGNYFATDCSKHGIGGGGLPEKINRYRRFREVVLFLNDPSQIGKITFRKALDTLVEEIWEAPLAPKRLEISYALREKKYNAAVENDRFPLPVRHNLVYSSVPYPNIANPDLLPVVYEKATTVKNATEYFTGDTENIVQFRHRMADGSINTHSKDYQQIALDGLMNWVRSMLTNTSSEEDFGKCWQESNSIKAMLPTSANPPPCTARLYPEELIHAVKKATLGKEKRNEYQKLCKTYRVAFNRKFGRPMSREEAENSKTDDSDSDDSNNNNYSAAWQAWRNVWNQNGGTRKRKLRNMRSTRRHSSIKQMGVRF